MRVLQFLGRTYNFLKWPMRLTLSFVLGILFSWSVIDPWLDDGIPQGQYAPLIVISNAAFQINITETVYDKSAGTITTWIRGDQGILDSGKTIFTHMVVNCKNNTVGILEQKVYGPYLEPITQIKSSGTPAAPKGLSSIAAIVTLCDDPNEAPPVQKDPQAAPAPEEPKEDHQDHDPGIQHPKIPKGPSISI